MRTEWDYSALAKAYLKRPNYSTEAINAVLALANINLDSRICDVGAGVGHLTKHLAKTNIEVVAVEPNDEMRSLGMRQTENLKNVVWSEGSGEDTKQDANAFDLVTFGSSFNVCNRAKALIETERILKPNGWFACLWNHRVLEEPIQNSIENIIKSNITDYGYGSRREDQTAVIDQSAAYGPVIRLSCTVVHEQKKNDCITAWRSHATLERQAGSKFHKIIGEIEDYLNSLDTELIIIPYQTNIWMSQTLS
jgi:ubiquinone/menaquinone biosynthesis C-methylase UbiE